MSLVLTRMEDKHRNITDVFRWMDQRGKGKVKKSDFIQSIERARISLAREDVGKVWNYIDQKQQGYITLAELSAAYSNRIHNFNKSAENAIESKAVKQYKEEGARKEEGSLETVNTSTINKPVVASLRPPLATQRVGNNQVAGRSPIVTKSVEHVFGAKNLESDAIGSVVQNQYMREATEINRVRMEEIAR